MSLCLFVCSIKRLLRKAMSSSNMAGLVNSRYLVKKIRTWDFVRKNVSFQNPIAKFPWQPFFARTLPFLRVPTLASLIANACCLCAKETVVYKNKIEINYICHMPASHNWDAQITNRYWAFPEKNCNPPTSVENIDFFEVDLPGFPIKFTVAPWNFPSFCINPPWKSMFFPQFPPLNSNDFYFTLEYSIDILKRGGGWQFFPEKSILNMVSNTIILFDEAKY